MNYLLKHKQLFLAFLGTFTFGLCAHAYCYFNLFYSHDSLIVNQEQDILWQTSIGRWGHALYLPLRSFLYNPFLVGMLSLFFLSIAVFLLIRLLAINNTCSILAVCAVLSSNVMLALANATYIYLSDIYMLAFLLAMLAIWFVQSWKFGFLPGTLCITLSLSLYQSFLQAALLVCIILFISKLLANFEIRVLLVFALKCVFIFLVGTILYLLIQKFSLSLFNVVQATSYNSVSNSFAFSSISELIGLFIDAYKYFLKYWINPYTFNPHLIAILFCILVVYSLCSLFVLMKKYRTKISYRIIILFIFILSPFVSNIIFVMTKGMEHALMIFSFFIYIVWAIQIFELSIIARKNMSKWNQSRKFIFDKMIVFGFCIVFAFNSIVFANNIYLKKDIEFKNTYSLFTRIIDRIEQTDGYMVGATPVVFVGSLEKSSYAQKPEYLFYDDSAPGTGGMFATTYYSTYGNFINKVMNCSMNVLDETKSQEIQLNIDVQKMTCYPDKDSCKMIDGVVVIKLSN